jgi:UDP-glucose 4-epimerase
LLDHPDSPGDPFNIGAVNEVTMNQLAQLIVEKTGSASSIVHIPYEIAYEEGFEDMERRVPDITKITALTGWQPTRTLDDILSDVIDFERRTSSVP